VPAPDPPSPSGTGKRSAWLSEADVDFFTGDTCVPLYSGTEGGRGGGGEKGTGEKGGRREGGGGLQSGKRAAGAW